MNGEAGVRWCFVFFVLFSLFFFCFLLCFSFLLFSVFFFVFYIERRATSRGGLEKMLVSIPAELLALVAVELRWCQSLNLAMFAASCTVCRAAAHGELRRRLGIAVRRKCTNGRRTMG